MQRQRDGLVPIGEALADLGGPVQALRETPPPARRGFTLADQVNRHCQRKVARTEFSTDDRELGRPELTPLGECGGAVELEIVS